MPVPVPVPDPLTRVLRNRLEATLPPGERASASNALNDLLRSVRNLPAVTHSQPPSQDDPQPGQMWPMAEIYRRLRVPVPGSQWVPLTDAEERTLHLVHYLHEVQTALPLTPGEDPAAQQPESRIHAHVLNELRREFRLMHCQFPTAWREWAVCDIAAKVMGAALRLGFQPTEVRVLGAQELPEEAGRHKGGVKLSLVAWNKATSLPTVSAPDGPNIWDPNNPLGNGPDLLRAPLQMDWAGAQPLEGP